MTVTEHATTAQATTTLKNRSGTNRNGASTEANADRYAFAFTPRNSPYPNTTASENIIGKRRSGSPSEVCCVFFGSPMRS